MCIPILSLTLRPTNTAHSCGYAAHLVVLCLAVAALLAQVPLQRLVPPLGRGHLRRVPLAPLGPPVLEPNLRSHPLLLLQTINRRSFTITEKAPTRAFKNLLRHYYAKRGLTHCK